MKNEDVYILSAVRTPVGSFNGVFSALSAVDLGAAAIRGALDKSGLEGSDVDEAYIGNVIQSNIGQAPARQAVKMAGLPDDVICTTINKVCASGLKAVALASQSIRLGDADVVIAGGMESMTNAPYYLPKARQGFGYGNTEVVDGLVKDGLTDAYDKVAMGTCGDRTADRYEITREQQDEYAISSYKKSAQADDEGLFGSQIVGVKVPQKKGEALLIAHDEEIRRVNFDKIPSLRPSFSPDGTVTAANASTLNDGAAALVLAGSDRVKELGLKPIGRIVAYADAEQEPLWFTTTPVLATKKVLEKAGLSIGDIDYFEVNEAFSVVALAYIKMLGVDPSKVNVWGGAVAIGHPLGASGARILTTLIHVLQERKGRYGLATICNGGGGATALIVERL